MSRFFFTVGHSVKVPLLDPENDAYVKRVELLSSFVSEAVERWDAFYDPSAKPDLPKHLAYVIRRLAEMLPFSDMEKIPEQEFFKKAYNILENTGETWSDRKLTEKALKILCAGLADIQSHLDHGLDPVEELVFPRVEIPSTGRKCFDASNMITFLDLNEGVSLVLTN